MASLLEEIVDRKVRAVGVRARHRLGFPPGRSRAGWWPGREWAWAARCRGASTSRRRSTFAAGPF